MDSEPPNIIDALREFAQMRQDIHQQFEHIRQDLLRETRRISARVDATNALLDRVSS